MKFRSLIHFSLLCLATFSASGCGEEKTTAAPAAPLEVKALRISKSDAPMSMEFIGQTKGAQDAEIRARVEGVITKISFEEGKEVQEGQLLYNIDPAPFQAKVAEAQGRLAEAVTRLAKAESDLKRVRPLVEMKALSARDLDAAIAQQGATQGAVDAAKASLESAQIELGYCEIKSPVKGVIGITKAKVGEFVGRSPNPIVLNTVSDLKSVRVAFSVSEKEYLYFARMKQKQLDAGSAPVKRELQLVLADDSVYPLPGEVSSVDREIDTKTGTMAVEASFPNPNQLLRPGQFAKIRVIAETVTGIVLVPKTVLRELQGQFQAFVIKADNTIEPRNVKVGRAIGEKQIVEEGLAENEIIAAEGLQRLRAGMVVSAKLEG